MSNIISIKDKPINQLNEDQLRLAKYAEALSHFILHSDTPMTVGLQGEWGTGKTSMMYLLQEILSNQNVATSWVNTWEYSMFRGAKETTPAVLKGMLEKLQDSCKNSGKWTADANMKEKVGSVMRFFGNIANQVVSQQTGIDLKQAASGESPTDMLASHVSILKKEINGVIDLLLDDPKNPYQMVVFFLDDLDRIPPHDAVEILEALKNIFDTPRCIYVLAIDYDVIVKGLESKFGPKTDANEREFRSFFDKIIQVPFTMPTGAYDIDFFLDSKLRGLGLIVSDERRGHYLNIVKLTVGFNPRALKRFLNTFSLLNNIRKLEETNDQQPESSEDIELMLFALLGVQISYPRIFRHVSQHPEFINWDAAYAAKCGLNWADVQQKIAEHGENDLVDEDWEKVVWGICQGDVYLKSKAFSILELLNSLRKIFGEDNLADRLQAALEFAAITSVDDNLEAKESVIKIGQKKIRYTGLHAKWEQLSPWANPVAVGHWKSIFSKLDENLAAVGSKINYAKTATAFYRWTAKGSGKDLQSIYCSDPKKNSKGMKIYFYAYGESFLDDMVEILSTFGWKCPLPETGEVEVAPELMIGIHKGDGWVQAQEGYLWMGHKFFDQQPDDLCTKLLGKIMDKYLQVLGANSNG